MAGISVNNNVNTFVTPVSSTATQNTVLNKQADALQDSFDTVMNRLNDKLNEQMNGQFNAAMNSQTMASGVSTDYSKQNTVKDEQQAATIKKGADKQTAGGAVEKEVSESKEEAVRETGEKLVEEVAEEMDVTPEEVEEAMEILGLTMQDLLNPENLKQLLIELSGNEDPMVLVTDAELYGHLTNLLSTLDEALETLQTELGLSEEDLNTLLADMAMVDDVTEGAAMAEELLSDSDVAEDVSLEGMKDYAVTVKKDGETVQVHVTVDDASGEQSITESVTGTSENTMQQDAKTGEKNASDRGEGNENANMPMQMPTQQTDVNAVTPEQQVLEHFTDTQDIMNQIMDHMKVHISSDVQEMELQLHPASLGNVHVQVVSKEGTITAQFTAQNEVVKAAIESQLIQLKEQFNEQGIKVNAVEVTVANYEAQQQFSGNEKEAGEEQQGSKKSHRRINLDELDLEDLPEDMDDSDKIAADMMARSGNTVDYTA